MRTGDLVRFAGQTLWQQKLRSLLNLVGVSIGAFILVFTFAAGEGIDMTVTRVFEQEDYLRTIVVTPRYGFADGGVPLEAVEVDQRLDPEKRERIRLRMHQDWQQRHDYRTVHPLTSDKLTRLQQLSNVESVTPYFDGFCVAAVGDHERTVYLQGIAVGDRDYRPRLVAGRFFANADAHEVIVNEYLAYLWGYATQEEMESLIGQTARLQFRLRGHRIDAILRYAASAVLGAGDSVDPIETIDRSLLDGDEIPFDELSQAISNMRDLPQRLSAAGIDADTIEQVELLLADRYGSEPPETEEVPATLVRDVQIVGIVRDWNPGEQTSGFGMWIFSRGEGELLLPSGLSTRLAEELPGFRENGFPSATIVVDDESDVKPATERIEELDLDHRSLLEFLEFLRGQIAIGKFIVAAIAAIVFFVSGMGIANTMIMTVMERTFEIGVMKAVGARKLQVLSVFLAEGTLIGVLGSSLAIGGSMLTALILDEMARQRLSTRMGLELEDPIFIFSGPLIAMVVVFSVATTLIATALPAWRAARVDPINALRAR